MRVAVVIGLGLVVVGAVLTWGTDWALAGADGDAIGAVLMIGGAALLFALIVYSAGRPEVPAGLEREPIDDTDDRLTAGWPRK